MARIEFSRKTKRDAFARAEGRCEWKDADGERCNVRLYPGNVEYDHALSAELGGDASLGNCQVLCKTHHRAFKTPQDLKTIAKSNRIRDKHTGAMKKRGRPIPGSRGSGIRKPMNGPAYRDPSW